MLSACPETCERVHADCPAIAELRSHVERGVNVVTVIASATCWRESSRARKLRNAHACKTGAGCIGEIY